jgi:N6-L-threonylcarbamoyladenine synthase
MIRILGVESSCDDTSIAVVDGEYRVLSNVVSSQIVHADYGGVVPELASRLHLRNILPVTRQALEEADLQLTDLSAVAVSVNPGLIGSLVVGVSFAKSLAYGLNIPLIAVNHMLAHVIANRLTHPELRPPYLALVVSGGHTELALFHSETEAEILGQTRDDAAGETFDKTAKILGLGYPGGPVIDRLAREGNPDFVKFPLGLPRKDDLDFSFSGLKTSVVNYVNAQTPEFLSEHKTDIAASVQKAIVVSLTRKTIHAAQKYGVERIVMAGGVSANRGLREAMTRECARIRVELYYPPLPFCTDNAAMVAAAAIPKFRTGDFAELDLNAFSKKGLRLI